MNINIEYLNGNKTIGLFFLRSEAVIPDRFKNLILLIEISFYIMYIVYWWNR